MSRFSSSHSWSEESRAERQSRMHSDGWSRLSGDDDDDDDAPARPARRRRSSRFGVWAAIGGAIAAGGLLVLLVRYRVF
ncbi:hypothetical protein [Caldimonas sp. KR1-144]|uniref:hypothetical protein n=1 Tax=Caldimonas sp. KR1-144 TaxID=3400911 RepID=UPI003BFE31EA